MKLATMRRRTITSIPRRLGENYFRGTSSWLTKFIDVLFVAITRECIDNTSNTLLHAREYTGILLFGAQTNGLASVFPIIGRVLLYVQLHVRSSVDRSATGITIVWLRRVYNETLPSS